MGSVDDLPTGHVPHFSSIQPQLGLRAQVANAISIPHSYAIAPTGFIAQW
jgi:hypothetical protein